VAPFAGATVATVQEDVAHGGTRLSANPDTLLGWRPILGHAKRCLIKAA